MYVPQHFSADLECAYALMAEAPFATLVSADGEGKPFATHLPLIVSPDRRQLLGHAAKANPHWRHWENDDQALAIFHGPHAYVSPSWYANTQAVPTWNYTAVHVTGTVTAVHETAAKDALLRTLIDQMEPAFAERMQGMPAELLEGMRNAIVGLVIDIAHVEVKAKLSQNRSSADRAGVIGMLEQGDDTARAVAALMRAVAPA